MGLRPRPCWGELTALPQAPWLYLRGPTSKGKGEGKGEEKGRKREGEELKGPPFRIGIGPPKG